MKKNRTILFVLLIPLLLELLVFFTAVPSGKGGSQTCIGQAEEVCDAFTEFECEETVDEESDVHAFGLPPAQQFHPVNDLACFKSTFSWLTDSAAPLASGWRMPLRI